MPAGRRAGEDDMLEKMKALVRGNNMCVLATVSGETPHCSLMAYATDDSCREIYMVTHRDTIKYRNLTKNPCVSLLIDTREEHSGAKRSEAKAMTVDGRYERIADTDQRERAFNRLLERHPHLRDFMDHPEAEILRIRIGSFLLLDGITDAHFERL